MRVARAVIILISLVFAPSAAALENEFDSLARTVIESLIRSDLEPATAEAATLVERYPESTLGQWLYAEVQSMNGLIPGSVHGLEQLNQPMLDILFETRTRLHARTPTDKLPGNILQTSHNTQHIVLVDLSASQLWLFDTATNVPTLMRSHYIASGEGGFGKFEEGDLKTPLGIYRIRGRRSDASLPDMYGSGALVLNYPNVFDVKRGRRGSGIWLHGVPKAEWNRPPLSSEGCVTMANSLFTELSEIINPATTEIVLENRVQWLDSSDIDLDRQEFLTLFSRFQNAWDSQTYSELENLYSDDFQPYAAMAPRNPLNRVSHSPSVEGVAAELDSELRLHLKSVQPQSINILRHGSLNVDKSFQIIAVMTFELGPSKRQMALYWTKDEFGQWRIVHQFFPPSSV